MRTWGYKYVFSEQFATGFPRFLIFHALIGVFLDLS